MASTLSLPSSFPTSARCSLGVLHPRRLQARFRQAVPVARSPVVVEGEAAVAVAAAAGAVDAEAEA